MEKIKKYIERRIKAYEEDIQEYQGSLSHNYERFFEWDAEDMYKTHKKMELYKDMLGAVEQGRLKEMLIHTIEHVKDDILYGSVQRRSTSSMQNLLCIFDIEVKQNMLQICKQMLNEISEQKS